MNTRKKYKAIICDIDGTLILNERNALPSKKVIKAIRAAGKKVHFGVATSRPLLITEHIIETFRLSGLCVLTGGSQIYNPIDKSIVWEKSINKSSIKLLRQTLATTNALVLTPSKIQNAQIPFTETVGEEILDIWVHGIELDELYQLEKALAKIKNICFHQMPSWKKGLTDLTITHKAGSKEHGIRKLIKILGLKKREVIAVGDGMNDLPLFKACGFKVAMGNAEPELKAIADYVAPSVEDDGIIDVIEKFIL
jgi:hypothetical protein